MDPRSLAVCAAVALSTFLAGCGSDKDKMEKRLSEMREEITRLQNSQDRAGERLMALEVQQAAAKKTTASDKAKGTAESAVERPPLKVIKLTPDGPAAEAEPAEPADDKADRPTIKLRGKEGALLDRPWDARVALVRQTQ